MCCCLCVETVAGGGGGGEEVREKGRGERESKQFAE